ncbi:alpha/beta hydrolase [Arenibacter sp. F26102]|uniref:alpha/beta hydrolase n=1 Tax=Arenibacter sp. F26102 TaxID=2926416 RepID=UPI001FF21B2B|nr:alpha/beta hydrolase [Arenibacter sp. F26102]MCK0147167.1 alpha/beta hydrolase [Arenibacter sp. F26102]
MIRKREQKLFTYLVILYFIFYGGLTLYAQNVIPIWSNLVPNSIVNNNYREVLTYDEDNEVRGISKVINPTLTIYLADENKSNGAAVIICPGGGYSHLSINKEGYKVAKWLNDIGVSAFVLKYRLPNDLIMKDKASGPLQDAQEAIRLLRRNVGNWKLNPQKIGVMGFSAGGHLASTLSTHYNEKVYNSDTINARPDFSILIYPVISMYGDITNKGSKVNLLGENVSAELIDKYSNEKQVDVNTPPSFLIHAMDDKAVPVENSINYLLALKEHQVPAELHIYEEGGHGFGLGREGANHPWPEALQKWLIAHDFVNE